MNNINVLCCYNAIVEYTINWCNVKCIISTEQHDEMRKGNNNGLFRLTSIHHRFYNVALIVYCTQLG